MKGSSVQLDCASRKVTVILIFVLISMPNPLLGLNLIAHVTHPELKTTFCLDILGVKKNPSSPLYTNLGVITKGTIIEVNVSELGLVTQSGKVVWGKYAQVTNNPELDGCINAVLLV